MAFPKWLKRISSNVNKLLLNEIPTWAINTGYNYYSMIYQGQLRLGLPVSQKLLQTHEKMKSMAASKLALTLYHMYFRITGIRIPRNDIKQVITDELIRKTIKLTENVIILSRNELEYLTIERFQIPKRFFPAILEVAFRRRILKESLETKRVPAYFESELEEREENQRGDYEFVYYRDYTEEGKEIRFRRLVSMEDVVALDDRPSIALIPGFANNSNCFNVSNDYSIAKDLADKGYWIYLFDPRGMGVNDGPFDPYYTVDTLIDYDLPTVVQSLYSRSKGKPSILLGHSMGGMTTECMLLCWSMRKNWNKLTHLNSIERSILDEVLPPYERALRNLRMVKSVVTLGSPKFFQKMSHIIYPLALWSNHLARIFNIKGLPIKEMFISFAKTPILRQIGAVAFNSNLADLNIMVCPENHADDKYFIHKYFLSSIESVPMGLGFQFLKSIYNGEGFKRMDESRLNYSDYYYQFPAHIPVFHFWGTKDPLAPPSNLQYSKYYPHKVKKVYHLEHPRDLDKVEITSERSQLIDFVIEGANHIDLLYGTKANELIYPIIYEIIEKVWDNWSYDSDELNSDNLIEFKKRTIN